MGAGRHAAAHRPRPRAGGRGRGQGCRRDARARGRPRRARADRTLRPVPAVQAWPRQPLPRCGRPHHARRVRGLRARARAHRQRQRLPAALRHPRGNRRRTRAACVRGARRPPDQVRRRRDRRADR